MAFDINRSVLTRNIGLKIISLFIAIMLWLYVITITDPKVIREKAVFPKIKGLNSRMVIVNDIKSIKVVYEGKRKEVITNSDKIYAFIDMSGKVDAQRISAPIRVFKPEEFDIIKLEPEKIDIELQEVSISHLDLKPEIKTKEGYYYKILSRIPESIEISGLNEKISKAQFAKAPYDLSRKGAGVYKDTVPINVFDFDYKLVEDIRIDPPEIYTEVEIIEYPSEPRKIKADTIGQPEQGYFIDKITITPEEAIIKAAPDVIDTIKTIKTRPIDVTGIKNSREQKIRLERIPSVIVEPEEVIITVTLKKGETK
ncbi:MAG: hypothetical protein C0601_05570 [Candidatus Muiribacterium halophilum]|uniref:YbbR-like domain-containing protein n=1 Tax=Muiribacterium halophilum TaxID=2053465 RepID=A0A2N5ZHN9_MUIH1|nr:MAG: hypothetical protein C0601_05570 [Candidatus Muirbacterium halophilum]